MNQNMWYKDEEELLGEVEDFFFINHPKAKQLEALTIKWERVMLLQGGQYE